MKTNWIHLVKVLGDKGVFPSSHSSAEEFSNNEKATMVHDGHSEVEGDGVGSDEATINGGRVGGGKTGIHNGPSRPSWTNTRKTISKSGGAGRESQLGSIDQNSNGNQILPEKEIIQEEDNGPMENCNKLGDPNLMQGMNA